MRILVLDGEEVQVDIEGYFIDSSIWRNPMAIEMAKTDGIELNDNHWKILLIARAFFEKFGYSPNLKELAKEIYAIRERKGTTEFICDNFPNTIDPSKNICRYVGIPKPIG